MTISHPYNKNNKEKKARKQSEPRVVICLLLIRNYGRQIN